MKKETAVAIISVLAVLAVVMGILFLNANGQNKDLTAQIESKKTEIQGLTDKITGLEGAAGEQNGQIETLTGDVTRLTEEAKGLQENIDGKAGEIETLTAEVARLTEEAKGLQGTIDEKAAQIETLTGDVTRLTGEADGLNAQIGQLGTDVSAREAQAKEWEAKYQTMRQNLKNMAVSRDKARAQAKEAENKLAEAEETIEALKAAEGEQAQVALDLEAAKKTLEQAQTDLDAANKAKEQAVTELEAAKGEIGELTKKIEELEKAAKAEPAPAAEETKPEETKTEEAKPEEAAATEEAKPAEAAATEEAKPEEAAATEEAKPEEAVATEEAKPAEAAATEEVKPAEAAEAPADIPVMTYAEYAAAQKDDEVALATYVQATQNWWDGKITVYAQSPEGACFIYQMACSEEDAAKLVPGTPIIVRGYKAEWGGEVEIMDATFEFGEGDPYIAEAADVTELIGTEELINCMNAKVAFKGLTLDGPITYKDDKVGEDDIYFTASKDGKAVNFCVEIYLTGADTEVYKAVQALQPGDVIDVEAFLYWYEGANPHVTGVTKAE